MKTCFNCGNSTRPETHHGKRNLKAMRAALNDFHPLEHFAFCARRKQWLDIARRDCVGWIDPQHFDFSKHHVDWRHKVHDVCAKMFDNHRLGWLVTVCGACAGASVLASYHLANL